MITCFFVCDFLVLQAEVHERDLVMDIYRRIELPARPAASSFDLALAVAEKSHVSPFVDIDAELFALGGGCTLQDSVPSTLLSRSGS